MTINISDNNPRISYSVASGVTQSTFTVPFEFFDDSDLNVYVDGILKTITSDYTVSGGDGSTGTVTMSVTGATSGSTVVLTRDTTIERVTDFTAGVDINRAALNTQLDTLTAISADVKDLAERSIRVEDLEIAPNLVLPSIANRANKLMMFDTEGAVSVASEEALGNIILGANFITDSFTGDGSTTAFTLSVAANSKNNTQVHVDGVYQNKATYSLSSDTLTFSEAPPLNSSIEVVSGDSIAEGSSASSSAIDYNQGGTGAVDRTVKAKLQETVSVKDFGAVGDGVTDDTAAFAAAETASDFVHVPEGTYRIASSLDFDATLVGDGGVLYIENATVNINGKIQSAPNPLFTFGTGVTFKITSPQDVYTDWFLQAGSEEFALRRAFEFSAAGSRILLLGKTYTTKAINWSNDPLDATGKDTGKTIEGVSPAQRYKTTGEFFGTRIVLADNEDANMFTIDSVGANTFGSGAIKNVMLEGNKGNQTAGSGIEIQDVKDFLFENVFVWNFYDDGISFSGANNQINLEGFIECWNNGRDGIRGGAIGDAQMSGSIRTVNNGRHGFYLAAGSGRYDQIYSYFNAERGVWIGPSVEKSLFINYLRSEDNDKEGCRIDAKNVSIDYCDVPDNGVTASVGTEQSGLYLSSSAENVNIRILTYPYRTSAVTHNQLYLLYDQSLRGCTIQNMVNPSYGQHSISGEETAVFSNNSSLNGCFVDRRMTVSDTYANLKGAGATITPKPDTYGRYNITDITENMTINNTAAGRSCEGMVIEFAVESNGSYNLNFGSGYLDASGSAISATALTSGQTAFARFQQTNGDWYLISPIVVA